MRGFLNLNISHGVFPFCFANSMATKIFFLLFASFLVSGHTHLYSTDEAFTSVDISQKGLDFIKDLLIDKAISSMIPLHLPKIEKTLKIPFLGNVRVVLSNATIYQINVTSSFVKPGDSGVAIIASGTTCNLSMNWYYSYNTWLIPVEISDKGSASVQVEGMDIGLTFDLKMQDGTLKLFLFDCGCLVRDISITMDGGESWLYQGMIDAFQAQIASAVENSISKNLAEGISKLDSYLQSLPKEIPVDDVASVNVTFVSDPLLSNSSIGFKINGLFTAGEKISVPAFQHGNSPLLSCTDPSKMLGIALNEEVFNSASALYYDATFMQWVVDKIPDQSLLNTAGWRFIIPQLYKKYPNDDMDLNISLSSPPVIKISDRSIDSTVYLDVIIDVLEGGEVVPVACISLEIRATGTVKISGNNLAGSVKLDDFSMSLKWSNIGNLRMYLIQPVIRTVIQTVVLPYANLHLGKGFPLPVVHGFTLENGQIVCSNSRIIVCSDVLVTDTKSLNDFLLLRSSL